MTPFGPLVEWESFYVVVGSAGAALAGLMFVVITLSAEAPMPNHAGIRAFGSPTVAHFATVLVVSAVTVMPHKTPLGLAVPVGLVGILGAVYLLLVGRRMTRQPDYVPVLEDWLTHVAAPLAGYLGLLLAAIMLPKLVETALFVVGASTLLLLLVGIRNAWDTAVYIAVLHNEARTALATDAGRNR